MSDIVKYHNDFNKIKLPSFTEVEQDLLCGLMVKLKEQKSKVVFYPSDLRSILKSSYDNESLLNFSSSLKEKFFKADFTIIEKTTRGNKEVEAHRTINLFTEFAIYVYKNSKELESIEIQVNPRFDYILNQLTANFTSFELAEFIALNGKYTKTLYRLLKQYRSTGKAYFEWEEFCRVMDIPEKFVMCDIDKRIIKPAIKELTAERTLFDQIRVPFKNLIFEKKKIKARGRGGKVIGIEFTFKSENITVQKIGNRNKLSDEEKQLKIIQNLIGQKIKYQDSILTINTIYEENDKTIVTYYNETQNKYGGFSFKTFEEMKEKVSKNLYLD
ncbi:replication initiation protein [Campylobacter lari]|nr:replication initiation protein [Campylobacter lari]